MDEEQREYNFPTEDSDDTKSPPEKSPEDARAAMQQSLQQFANGVAQSLAVTHEVAKIVGPALLNFAKKAQEISVAVKPVLEAFQQWMVSFSEAILQWQIPTISEERKQELILSHTVKKDLKLSDRIFKCSCGYVEDRDFNAALNLRDAITYEVA